MGDITTGLIGHWKLDEQSGTVAVDSVNPGTLDFNLSGFTLPSDWTDGPGLYFDGDANGVTAGNARPSMGVPNLTYSCWLKRDLTGTDNQALIALGTDVGLVIDGSSIQFFIYDGTSYEFSTPSALADIDDESAHLITVSFNDSTTTARIYVDGIFAVQHDYSASIVYAGNGGDDLCLGGLPGQWWLKGRLADVRIYNRVLADADVADLALDINNPFAVPPVDVSITETATATDTGSSAVVAAAAISESATVGDAETATIDAGETEASITESSTASDSAIAQAYEVASIQVELVLEAGVFPASVSESAAASDSESATAIAAASVSESASASDGIDTASQYNLSLVESASATDSVTTAGDTEASVSESAQASDEPSSTAQVHLSLVESASAGDSVNYSDLVVSAALSEAVTATVANVATAVIEAALSESATAAELTGGVIGDGSINVGVSESATATADLSTTAVYYLGIVESADASDQLGTTSSQIVDVSESASATSGQIAGRLVSALIGESVAVDFASAAQKILVAAVTEASTAAAIESVTARINAAVGFNVNADDGLVTRATTYATITDAVVASVTQTSFAIKLDITTPDNRTFVVSADVRVYDVEHEPRKYSVN